MPTFTPVLAWNAGRIVTATDLNTYVSGNDAYLLNRPNQKILRNNASNYTTTSTTFVDVDTTNLAITLVMSGGTAEIKVAGIVSYPASGGYFDVTVDGTRYSGATNGITGQDASSGGVCIAFSILVTGLSAGSHTFKLQWRAATAATMTLQSTSAMQVAFSAQEVS